MTRIPITKHGRDHRPAGVNGATDTGGQDPVQAYTVVQDEGGALTQRAVLDFAGSGVTATDDPSNVRTLVTIPGAPPSGTPIGAFVANTTAATFTGVPDGTNKNLGVPTGMIVGDVAVMAVSCKNELSGIAGTISTPTGSWSALNGATHDSQYVWRLFAKQITGLDEITNWDQVAYAGGGTHTMVGMIVLVRNLDPLVTKRADIIVSRTANLNPLVTGDLTTLARPGDLLVHFVSSKNGAGGVSPPSGYTELIDQFNTVTGGNLWTYLSYKVAVGDQTGGEKNASLSITPGSISDHNDTYLAAIKHA